MTPKRYNEILIAVVDGGFALICASAFVVNWLSRSKQLVIRIRRDSNSDGVFTEADGSKMLTVPVADFSSFSKIPNEAIAGMLEKELH
jgi:hypothetical protein